jgi:hypothetical protein
MGFSAVITSCSVLTPRSRSLKLRFLLEASNNGLIGEYSRVDKEEREVVVEFEIR